MIKTCLSRKMPDGAWKMEDGGWKMEDGRWNVLDIAWKLEDGSWKIDDVDRMDVWRKRMQKQFVEI